MHAFVKTDIGLVRETNEDSYAFLMPSLFAVADGMGGHLAGEIASKMAVETICEYIRNNQPASDYRILLEQAIKHANRIIYQRSVSNPCFQGMGTTITAVFVEGDNVYWAHAGDSRLYFIRNNSLFQITDDHSLTMELLRNGAITPDDAQTHPHRNILTRAVGTGEHIIVDSGAFEWKYGDKLFLCTDGLTNMVPEAEIQNVIAQGGSAGELILDKLVAMAKDAGGSDNITCILLFHEEEPAL